MNPITIQPGTPTDVDALTDIMKNTITWLATKGSDQWQNMAPGQPDHHRIREGFTQAQQAGTLWVARDTTGQVLGGMIVNTYVDPDFWNPTDKPQDALYLHRLLVHRDHTGKNIAQQLLQHARNLTTTAGKTYLRLDAWATNTQLQQYYQQAGFTQLPTRTHPHRGSGARFQQAVIPTASKFHARIAAKPTRPHSQKH